VTVKSVVDDNSGNGYSITLQETDRNTGRFEGYVKVFERTSGDTDGTAGTSHLIGGAATVAAVGGPVTVSYEDATTSGSAVDVIRTTSITLDTTPPTATISSPSTGSETQNRLPTFTGDVVDNQSGIDLSEFDLHIDRRDDADNALGTAADYVIASTVANDTLNAPTIQTGAGVSKSGYSDGVTSMSWTHTPSTVLPNATITNPDHIVDFQVRVADLAGNIGYSDSDTASATYGRLGNKPHTVKIDVIIPQIASASSGTGFDAENSADKANVRDTIKVTFDGNVKASSISPSDFKITLSGGGVFVPASVVVNGDDVYLDLDSTIPSNNTPTVTLQGTIQDLAGNSTDAGSMIADDDLAPVITVTRSGGTGSGTGAEGSDSLTKSDMVITVSSDEDLNGPPTISITDLTNGDGATAQAGFGNAVAVAQGGNVWKLTIPHGGVQGNRAVKVVAQDLQTNQTEVGDLTTKAYVVDREVGAVTMSPANGGNTTQSNPFITAAFSDQSTLSVTSATLDGVDVTSSVVASADKKKFFFQPTTALSNGTHTFVLKVTDAAGNVTDPVITTVFTKASRTDFVINLFAGWNAVSVPSNPVDSSIDSVFSNAGVKQVIAYDATTPAQPWRIASKVDGSFSSQTSPGLTSVHAGHGYWVETGDFENQKVALEGPTGPGDARPGLTTIPVGSGWNFVGVVDQSRIQTQSGAGGTQLNKTAQDGTTTGVIRSGYFGNQNVARAYTFDTVDSEFRTLEAGDDVVIGSGIWAFISPQQNGKLPHIVP